MCYKYFLLQCPDTSDIHYKIVAITDLNRPDKNEKGARRD